MSARKTAVIIDSGTDVNQELIERFNMYVIPLGVNYSNGSYLDKINITSKEVCERFEEEIPSTSLPTPSSVCDVYTQVLADGYENAIVVSISSGLSATYETFKMMAERFPTLNCKVIDTKNIGIGAGFTAIRAAELIAEGVPFSDLEAKLLRCTKNTKIFFCVETLKYLKAGGRIGEITYLMGCLMNVNPIISCNEKGVYYTAKKVHGHNQAITKAIELAKKFASEFSRYNIAIAHGGAEREAEKIRERIKEVFPLAEKIFSGEISPALIVHTGPGVIGIGVQGLSSRFT